jgi:hypothetical protein
MTATDSLPRDSKGQLVKYAWPGGYPVLYVTELSNVLCPDCANRDTDSDVPVAADINWEDPSLYCDDCSERIESAYAEDEVQS